jgi:hypothetical protein
MEEKNGDAVHLYTTLNQLFQYLNSMQNQESLIKEFPASEFPKSAYIQISDEYRYWAGSSFSGAIQASSIEYLPNSCEPADFWPLLKKRLLPTDLVVDLGSGVRPNFFIGQQLTICVELFEPYLKYLQNTLSGERVITIKEDVLSFLKRQPSRSIETIVVTDLIEHLSKEDGELLIQEIERTVQKQALIVTPKGFMPQHVGEFETDAWEFTGNVLQNHISGWEPEDFAKWEVVNSRNYYIGVEHPEGVIGCTFFPETFERTDLHVVLEEFSDQTNMVKLASSLFTLLNNHFLTFSELKIKFTLPLMFSPKSTAINPEITLPNVNTEYSSFNWEVNNFNYQKDSGERIFLPGTMSSSVSNTNSKRILLLKESLQSKIMYDEIFSQNISIAILNDHLISALMSYVDGSSKKDGLNFGDFLEDYFLKSNL